MAHSGAGPEVSGRNSQRLSCASYSEPIASGPTLPPYAAAATCQGASTLGLRTNGTLWVWGRIYAFSNRLPAANTFPTPTRFCRETNWAGLSTDSGGWAWTQSGEVWLLTGASPNPEATVA